MENSTNLGRAVAFYRQKKRWTRGQLGTYSGVTPAYIGRLEKGERGANIRQSTLEKIAHALDVTVDELLHFSPNKLAEPRAAYTTEGTRRQRLYTQLNQLSDNQLEALERMLEVFLSGGNRT